MNFVGDELADLADTTSLFSVLDQMEGEVYRALESRRTFRFQHNGKFYFAKLHYGAGWREIFKNLVSFRLPVLGATNELKAVRHLEHLGIDTMRPVAFVSHQGNPATRKSCIVTVELENTKSLEELVDAGQINMSQKRRLIRRVAEICRLMHDSGLNHRDLYICHFHLALDSRDRETPKLYVIDLHRAQLRHQTPSRWRIKDVGGLFFSVFDGGLTRTDAYRFIRAYTGKSLGESFAEDSTFWRAVARRAIRLWRSKHGSAPIPEWVR
ncbi:MAG: lipopolysaccharide core heptose(I) kinase RfaP [Pseudomonadales bacterium]